SIFDAIWSPLVDRFATSVRMWTGGTALQANKTGEAGFAAPPDKPTRAWDHRVSPRYGDAPAASGSDRVVARALGLRLYRDRPHAPESVLGGPDGTDGTSTRSAASFPG